MKKFFLQFLLCSLMMIGCGQEAQGAIKSQGRYLYIQAQLGASSDYTVDHIYSEKSGIKNGFLVNAVYDANHQCSMLVNVINPTTKANHSQVFWVLDGVLLDNKRTSIWNSIDQSNRNCCSAKAGSCGSGMACDNGKPTAFLRSEVQYWKKGLGNTSLLNSTAKQLSDSLLCGKDGWLVCDNVGGKTYYNGSAGSFVCEGGKWTRCPEGTMYDEKQGQCRLSIVTKPELKIVQYENVVILDQEDTLPPPESFKEGEVIVLTGSAKKDEWIFEPIIMSLGKIQEFFITVPSLQNANVGTYAVFEVDFVGSGTVLTDSKCSRIEKNTEQCKISYFAPSYMTGGLSGDIAVSVIVKDKNGLQIGDKERFHINVETKVCDGWDRVYFNYAAVQKNNDIELLGRWELGSKNKFLCLYNELGILQKSEEFSDTTLVEGGLSFKVNSVGEWTGVLRSTACPTNFDVTNDTCRNNVTVTEKQPLTVKCAGALSCGLVTQAGCEYRLGLKTTGGDIDKYICAATEPFLFNSFEECRRSAAICRSGSDHMVESEGKFMRESLQFFSNVLEINSVQEGVVVIIKFLLGLVGLVSLVTIVLSGVRYILAGGNEQKLSEAKQSLTGAIGGLIIALIAFSVVSVIVSILKVK